MAVEDFIELVNKTGFRRMMTNLNHGFFDRSGEFLESLEKADPELYKIIEDGIQAEQKMSWAVLGWHEITKKYIKPMD